jgi:hypothetical protein
MRLFTIKVRASSAFGVYHQDLYTLIAGVEAVKIVDALPRLARRRGIDLKSLKEIDSTCGEFMAINEIRVVIAHGLWASDLAGTIGVARRPKKKGALKAEWSFTSAKELLSLSERCQALLQRFMRLPLGRDPSAAQSDA